VAAVLGVACVLVGAWLAVSPFASLAVLVLLVAAGLLLNGLLELAAARSSLLPRPTLQHPRQRTSPLQSLPGQDNSPESDGPWTRKRVSWS
jgi:hypothetical protein